MMSIGYKIVRSDHTSLYANGHYEIHYQIGEVAYAPHGTMGLSIFDTLESAMDFMGSMVGGLLTLDSIKILTVEYDSTTATRPVTVSAHLGWEALDRYYGIRPGIHPGEMAPPDGTICCMCCRVLDEWKPN